MKLTWYQLPDDFVRVRAVNLAGLLSEAKRVTRGDAIALALDLWGWVLGQVDEASQDLRAEFSARSLLPGAKAPDLLCRATGWPLKHKAVLLHALLDPSVRLLEQDGPNVRVLGLERYLSLAADQREASQRARCGQVAKAAGWAPEKGKGWVHQQTGEVIENWRDLWARLQPKASAVVEGRLMPLKAARVVRAAEEE